MKTISLLNSVALVSLSNAFAATAAADKTKGGPSGKGVDLTKVAQDAAQNTTAETAPADPFAELPTIQVGDYRLTDLSSMATADPRKYSSAQEAALKAKSQLKPGWKHATAMLLAGPHQPEGVKPTSVMGQIMNKVASYGRAGVPAYVIVDFLRREAMGNKRSHFCNGKVPPIGWAEDYINGALSKKYIKVWEGKTAPALSPELEQVAEQAAASAAKTGTNG